MNQEDEEIARIMEQFAQNDMDEELARAMEASVQDNLANFGAGQRR